MTKEMFQVQNVDDEKCQTKEEALQIEKLTQLIMNQKFWVYQMNHNVSNSLVFFVWSENSANIDV